jgi:hypothetical protein
MILKAFIFLILLEFCKMQKVFLWVFTNIKKQIIYNFAPLLVISLRGFRGIKCKKMKNKLSITTILIFNTFANVTDLYDIVTIKYVIHKINTVLQDNRENTNTNEFITYFNAKIELSKLLM